MTTLTQTTAQTTPQPLSKRLSHGLTALFRHVRRRTTAAQPATPGKRLLRDIGPTRIDVEAMRHMW